MQNKFDKTQIVASFNRAAKTYNQANFLQRKVGDQLFLGLNKFGTELPKILDLGCGTGILTEKLADDFPRSYVLGIDIAGKMIQSARKSFIGRKNLSFLCADTDDLPIKDKSVDLVFSNLMLQWSSNIRLTLSEIGRALRSGGHLVFSTFGPRSLNELRTAWSNVDHYVHVNHFMNKNELLCELAHASFECIGFETVHYCRKFHSIYDLMLELKMLGAHNINPGRSKGLLGKNKFMQFKKYYDVYQDSVGKLLASFEIYYVYAIKKNS